MTTERRTVEIRLSQDPDRGSAGILTGTLLPFNVKAADRNELFEPRSLTWPEDGILLREMHDRSRPIARFTPTETDSAVEVRIALPDTVAGRSAKAAVVAGVYKSLSVEFVAQVEEMRQGLRIIKKAVLVGAGLVDQGAYAAATIEARAKGKRRRLWL